MLRAKQLCEDADQIDSLLFHLARTPNNYTYRFIQSLNRRLGPKDTVNYLATLSKHKLIADRDYGACAQQIAESSADEDLKTNLTTLANVAIKRSDDFNSLIGSKTITNLVAINDKVEVANLLKKLLNISKSPAADANFYLIINDAIDKLESKERTEVISVLEGYAHSGSDAGFSEALALSLRSSSPAKFFKFFQLLKEYNPTPFAQIFVLDLINSRGQLSKSVSESTLQRLSELTLGTYYQENLQTAVKSHPAWCRRLLTQPEEMKLDPASNVAALLIRSDLSAKQIAIVSGAISAASTISSTSFLADILAHLVPPKNEEEKENLLHSARFVTELSKLGKEPLFKLGPEVVGVLKESLFLRQSLKLCSKDERQQLTLLLNLLKYHEMKQSMKIVLQLENLFTQFNAKFMTPLLQCMNKYSATRSNGTTYVGLSDAIYKFFDVNNSKNIGELLGILNRLPILQPNSQELLLTCFQNRRQLGDAAFQHILENIERFDVTNLMPIDNLFTKFYDFHKDTYTLEKIGNFHDLALYILLNQSGAELERNSKALSKLAGVAKAFNKEKEILSSVLGINKDRDFRIDLNELENWSDSDLKVFYELANDKHQLSRNDLSIIAKLTKAYRRLAEPIIDLILNGNFGSFVHILRESASVDNVDAMPLIEFTKIFDKYLNGIDNWRTVKTVLLGLVAVGTPMTVLESAIKKLRGIASSKEGLTRFLMETASQVRIAQSALGIKDQGASWLIGKARDDHYDEGSMLSYLDSNNGSELYFLTADSPPTTNSRYKEFQLQSYDVYRTVYDIHHGFGALTYEFRRTPTRDDPNFLRFARDVGKNYYHVNALQRDKYPGKGLVLDGLDLQRMFGFPPEFQSENQKQDFEKLKAAYKQNLPWMAEELDDVADTKYIFLTGMIAIIPPKTKKYFLPGATEPVHYAMVTYNDHFDSDVTAVSYLVPSEILEDKINPALIKGDGFTGFDRSKTDICDVPLKIADLEAEAQKRNLNILNLGWASNAGGGMCNAYPIGSSPFHNWETRISANHTKDLNGHTHKTHINDNYESNENVLARNKEYVRLGAAHKFVYDVSTRFANLVSTIQLALSLRHKGFSYFSEPLTEVDTFEDDQEQTVELGEGDLDDSQILDNPYTKYMLLEGYKWHNSLHEEARFKENKADKNSFPIIAITPTFSWSDMPQLTSYFDTFDRTLHIREEDGAPEKIIQFKTAPGEMEEMYWNQYIFKPALNTDKDIRLLDRSSLQVAV